MKEVLNLALIGLGQRGIGLLNVSILEQPDVRVTAVCDVYEDRQKEAAKKVTDAGQPEPAMFADYRDVLKQENVDAVLISAAWEAHVDLACAAMKAGKITALEVGGAYSVDDCWRLVHTYEETGTPFMFMENCCYGRTELMITNMVRQGLFGEIAHCRGGYGHDLREEISNGREMRHYRFQNYLLRNCENYPTHELGPICNLLGVNRGNRMLTLCSMASKSVGLHQYLVDQKGADYDAAGWNFKQGDVVTTIIKCAGGETICLTLETTLPRAYSRNFEVHGSKGVYMEDGNCIFLDGVFNHEKGVEEYFNNAKEYQEQYDHPVWKKFLSDGIKGGHGGMDWLIMRAFLDAALSGEPMPIDVYDAAAWMSITALSEQSIAMGGMPVAIPDFTNGKWLRREMWNA